MRLKVLIADDDQELRSILRFFLEQHDVQVTEASNGLEALQLLAESQFDLLVLDLLMPIQDGFTTLKQLRSDAAFAELPVIILSSLAQEANVSRALRLGASDFLKKPFSPNELYERVKRLITSTPSMADAG